ncbi:MAG: hypothetical protein ACREL7_13910 [Longimicrobiales bacterium]
MKRRFLMLAALLGLGLAACSSGPSDPNIAPNETVIDATSNVPFQLRAGEIARFQDQLLIAFRNVSADSRCASDVQCVWSGDATVHLEVTIARMAWSARDLHTHVEPHAVDFRDYRIRLVGLAPNPISTQVIAPGDYVATLEVTRKP